MNLSITNAIPFQEQQTGNVVHTLVTGSSGHVAGAIREAIPDSVGLDLKASNLTQYIEDIRTCSPEPATSIVHCAALTSVPASIDAPRPDASTNIDGTIALLDLARKWDVERFIQFSSAATYSPDVAIPVHESAKQVPNSPYGLSKLTSERYAQLYHELYGIPTVILRPFNIYGPRATNSSGYASVILAFKTALEARKPATIFGDGSQTRDFVHCDDIVQAVKLGLTESKAIGNAYNVGTGVQTSIRELWDLMADIAHFQQPAIEAPTRQGELQHSVANIDAIRGIGFAPRVSLREGLHSMLANSQGLS